MKLLTLIRGVSGSGKTTLALAILGAKKGEDAPIVCETDHFFVDPVTKEYSFNGKKRKEAHFHCQKKAELAMAEGKPVIVSNTFTQCWEMRPYLNFAKHYKYKVQIICIDPAGYNFGNVHDASDEVVEKQRHRFEY